LINLSIGRRDFSGGINTPAGTLTAGGRITRPGVITFNSRLRDSFVHSTIANNGTGAVSLVKAGSGDLLLNYANTYTGGTYVAEGSLRVVDPNGLGGGSAQVAAGARFESECLQRRWNVSERFLHFRNGRSHRSEHG
jgi:autotransporter-associated beta strand protein